MYRGLRKYELVYSSILVVNIFNVRVDLKQMGSKYHWDFFSYCTAFYLIKIVCSSGPLFAHFLAS